MTKTALIFAHECAPFNRPESTIGAQRPAQFAKHLQLFDWRAIVICCDHARRESLAVKDLPQVRADVSERLRESGSLVIPTPSLVEGGWLDRAWRANRQRPALRRVLTAAKFFRGDWSESWQPCAKAAAETVAANVKIDVCLAEHGPDAGIFLARWFAKQYNVPWLADLRDPLLRPFRGVARRVYARVARQLLKTAAGTIAVTPVWAEMDAKLLGKRVWCIPNGYDPEEFAPVEKKRNERFTVAFAGNIRESFDIFIEGLRLAQEHLGAKNAATLCFCYWGVSHERVKEKAARAGVAEIVEARAHTPREAALQAIGNADLLLLLTLPESSKRDPYLAQGLYPGKLFEYWGARRPVLCVPGDGGLLEDLLRCSRTGTSAGAPAQVADALLEAWQVWRQGGELPFQPDETVLADFTRQNLAGKLADALNTVTDL
jgi:glycosyltransferase involved in cell wall biosynthesis